MPARTLVVVNPRARGGAAGRRFAALEAPLRAALGACDVERTRGPRDAERLAREAARAGCERIVVAGGDGTFSEAACGLLSAGLGERTQLGLLPIGTGGDFALGAGLPRDARDAIERLVAGPADVVDAMRVRFRGRDGGEASAYGVNVASFGVSGAVVDLVNRTTKVFGGRVSFLVGTLRALARHRSEPVALRIDGESVHEGPLVLAAAANGSRFGGGMRVAPDARLDDGLLDVVWVAGLSKPRLVAKLPRLYAGTHLDDPAVASRRGRVVEADAEPGRVPLEVDGEPLGTLPARIEVLPGALRLLGLRR